MIGTEDFHETQKKNHTPTIVLVAAAVLLLIVGFISYRDYVNSRADKRVADSDRRIAELEEKIMQLGQSQGTGTNQGPGSGATQAPPPPDPEYEKLRRQLEEMRQRTEENSRKVKQLSEGGARTSPPELFAVPKAPGNRDDEDLPGYVRDSVSAPPGGKLSPEAERRLADLRQKVRNAPSIGSVVSYNLDWNFVTIDAGTENGIKVDDRYSVRRGSEVLGIVKVRQVFPTEAIAGVVTKNVEFDGALKPQAGDEIIAFDPF